MKNKFKTSRLAMHEPTEDEIRDYAFHLYQQSGCVPGHDMENWLEAKACLEANIPKHHTRARLHRHRHPEAAEVIVVAIEAQREPMLDPSAGNPDNGARLEREAVLSNLYK